MGAEASNDAKEQTQSTVSFKSSKSKLTSATTPATPQRPSTSPVAPPPPSSTHSVSSTDNAPQQSADTLPSFSSGMDLTDTNTRKSAYDEIYDGPSHFGSFLLKTRAHLTLSIDKTYFGGKAGQLRIITMILGTVSIGLGLPGFSQTQRLYQGYGEGPLGLEIFSILFMCISLLMSITFILLLLFFKEVRCQAKWDDWNMFCHAVAAFFASVSGILELGAIFETRRGNCDLNLDAICVGDHLVREDPEYYERKLNLHFKIFHYTSALAKCATGMLFSRCARICLKNSNRIG